MTTFPSFTTEQLRVALGAPGLDTTILQKIKDEIDRRTRRNSRSPKPPGKPSYQKAIRWIADNDDTDWLGEENGQPSVTASMVADIYEVSITRVACDIHDAIGKAKKDQRGR